MKIVISYPHLSPEWEHRFLSLTAIEQRRFTNLLKYMNAGNELSRDVLAGFPRESLELLRDMFSEGKVVEP